MDKQSSQEILTCPDLFDGMEQFIADEWAQLRRTSAITIAATLPLGLCLAWLLNPAN